uniref:T-box domain-containing protein n=1 Tax=Panagrolaimus sp. PS1159 TaxID=55785 RepID=A0AC35FKJ8_9BILA
LETNVPNTNNNKKLIAIAEDISLEDLKKRINVKLANEETWKKFDKIQLEMVVTKNGRTLYPKLEFNVEGLERDNRYLFFVSFSLADDLNVKYKYVRGKWISYQSYDDRLEGAEVPHTDNAKCPFGFDWMFPTSIVFEKLKITNNAEIANNNSSNYAHLKSFRKYRPSFIIHRYNPTTEKFEKFYEKEFSIAEFIVVTSYHDPRVTHIKVDNNPYAKAFRGENITTAGKVKVQKPPSLRYQRSSTFPSTSNLRHHNLLSQPFLSYNRYYQQPYHPYFIPPPPPSPATQVAMLQRAGLWPTSFSQPSTVNSPTTTTSAATATAAAAAPTATFLYNQYYPLMLGYNPLFGSLSWIPRLPPPPYQAQTSFNQFHVILLQCQKNTLLNRNPDDGNNNKT